jgi:hypothetical protein
MSMTEPERVALARLVDREAISACLLRYARGVDRADPDLIRSAFWEDAHDSHGRVTGSIDNFLDFFLPRQPDRQVAQHFITNHAVQLRGGSAASEAYFMSVAKSVHATDVELVGGRYLDTFEKRGDEWRIATRLVVLDWQTIGEGAMMAARLATANLGSRTRSDPSYAIFSTE